MLPERLSAINELLEPSTLKELRHALGLINFQRRFIKNAAKTLVPSQIIRKEKLKMMTKFALLLMHTKLFKISNMRRRVPLA